MDTLKKEYFEIFFQRLEEDWRDLFRELINGEPTDSAIMHEYGPLITRGYIDTALFPMLTLIGRDAEVALAESIKTRLFLAAHEKSVEMFRDTDPIVNAVGEFLTDALNNDDSPWWSWQGKKAWEIAHKAANDCYAEIAKAANRIIQLAE